MVKLIKFVEEIYLGEARSYCACFVTILC